MSRGGMAGGRVPENGVMAAGCGGVVASLAATSEAGAGAESALAFGGPDHRGWLLGRRDLSGVITIACIPISEKQLDHFSRPHC